MVRAKLDVEMKKYIEENTMVSNRGLADYINRTWGTKVSHTIVGRHKKVFLETKNKKLETPTVKTSSRMKSLIGIIPDPDDKAKDFDRATKLLMKINRRRAIPNKEMDELLDLVTKYMK